MIYAGWKLVENWYLVSRISSYVDMLSHPINCKIACYNLKNLDKVMVT